MKKLAIINGRLIDPANNIDGDFDIVSTNGRITSVKPKGAKSDKLSASKDLEIIDAKGMIVTPGLVDIHTHLREPGFEYKETIKSGTLAGAAGGFTTLLCMANTEPVNDNASVTRLILKKAKDDGVINVHPIGALSEGLKGERLSEMAELKEAGIVAVSDDGLPVTNPSLMRRALEYTRALDMAVITHAEEPKLAQGGSMNEGSVSTRLGLTGIPNAVEDSMVARDIQLAELTGGHLHIAHVSTRGAVSLIRDAKARGVNITAEVTPHHLLLDDSAILGYDTNAKMSPPLRSKEDISALIEGLGDGTIDAIATDHAPHSVIEKDLEFDMAANGIVGLETALGLILGLVNSGKLDISKAIAAMTVNPSRCMGLGSGTLSVDAPADITIIDPELKWTVEPEKFFSLSRNTPFGGTRLKGRAVKTIKGGKSVFSL